MQAREGDCGADAQAAGKVRSRATGRKVRVVRRFHRSTGAFVEIPARFGWREAARGTHQQTHPEPLFQLCDRLGNGGLTDAQVPRSRGERPGLHDANEGFHYCQAIHVHASGNEVLDIRSGDLVVHKISGGAAHGRVPVLLYC